MITNLSALQKLQIPSLHFSFSNSRRRQFISELPAHCLKYLRRSLLETCQVFTWETIWCYDYNYTVSIQRMYHEHRSSNFIYLLFQSCSLSELYLRFETLAIIFCIWDSLHYHMQYITSKRVTTFHRLTLFLPSPSCSPHSAFLYSHNPAVSTQRKTVSPHTHTPC